MLIGEFHHNLDNKSRLVMPSKLLSSLGAEVIVTRGFEKCLLVYPALKWESMVQKFSELSITKSDTRKFLRIFLSGATSCIIDSQNRIVLSATHKSYAGISKEVVILGLDDHLEIWDSKAYNEFLNENLDSFAEIAESIYE